MKCLECQDLLQKHLDGDRIAEEGLEQHLNECSACREQHAAAMRLRVGLERLPKPLLPAGFAYTMVAQVIADRRQRQVRTQRRVFVTMALAASVLLMLFAAYYWMPRTPSDHTQPKQQMVDNTKKDAPGPKEKGVIKVERPEPRHALTALTERFADATRDHAKVVLVAANLDAMDKLPPMDALPVDPSLREAGQEVSDGVRTVTRNARKAFDFFARELPMPDAATN